MSRCILVIGTGRCGTSAVARVLHEALDVFMGKRLLGPGGTNKNGHYEDLDAENLLRVYRDGGRAQHKVRAFAALRSQSHPLWGMKSPNLVFAARDFMEPTDDSRIVCCVRDRSRCIRSFEKAYSWDKHVASMHYQKRKDAEEELLQSYPESLIVDFDQLLDHRTREVCRLHDFVLDEPYQQGRIALAANLIDPSLRNIH